MISPVDKMIAEMRDAGSLRRDRMRRAWKQRMQRLIRDITKFGRDDATCGSWDPEDMDVFIGRKPAKHREFERRIQKLAKEYIP